MEGKSGAFQERCTTRRDTGIVAWELRNKRRYFYRGVRRDGKVAKVCLGAGDAARHAAEKDAAKQAKRAQDQAEVAAIQAAVVGVDQLMADVHEGLAVLTEAALLVQGFHQHHGQWRRCRDVDKTLG